MNLLFLLFAVWCAAEAGEQSVLTTRWSPEQCLNVLQNESDGAEQRISAITAREFDLSVPLDYYPEFERQKREHRYALLTDTQRKALDDLNEAGTPETAYILGRVYLYGNYSVPMDPEKALYYYEIAAQESDNSTVSAEAHYSLGFIYSSGLFGQVEQNQGKSLLHYTAAADLGHIRAAMCLGYRFYAGISVEKDEQLSLYYYSRVARHCASVLGDSLGPPNLDTYAVRLSDFNDGLYGSGVSENLPRPADDELAIYDDVDTDPTDHYFVEMFHAYEEAYKGGYLLDRNYTKAFKKARKCAKEGLRLPSVRYYEKYQRIDRTLEIELTGRCAAAVGHMYLRGEGTEQNYTAAKEWLVTASKLTQEAQLSADLGLIYQYGLGLPQPDTEKAAAIYGQSYNTPAISYQWGKLLAEQGDSTGWKLIWVAAYNHYPPALYTILQSYEQGNPISIKGSLVLNLAKAFVESVEPAVTDLHWAFQSIAAGDNDRALLAYGMAADQGYEAAQSSAAYLLYPPVGFLDTLPRVPVDRFRSALGYYRESARQGNIDSMIFLGDLYSTGLPNSTYRQGENETFKYIIPPDKEKAVGIYREASSRRSHQASFDLGYAYETGTGVPVDLHLAKRYYDKALALKPEAYIPVQLSLARLKFKRWWAKITGKSVDDDNDRENLPKRTWHELLHLYDRLRAKQMPPEPNQNLNQLAKPQAPPQQPQTPGQQRQQQLHQDDELFFLDDGPMELEDWIACVVGGGLFLYIIYQQFRARFGPDAQQRRERIRELQRRLQRQQNGEGGDDGGDNDNDNDDVPPPAPAEPQFRFMFIPL